MIYYIEFLNFNVALRNVSLIRKRYHKSTFLVRISVKKITSIFTSRHESILTLTSLTTKNGVQNELQEYKTELYEGVWSLVCVGLVV